MTIQEACQRLGKSESTIRRWIKTGKLTAKLVDGTYDISEDAINCLVNSYPNDKAIDSQPEGVDQGNEKVIIKRLEAENEYLKERIQELEQARQRADMITLQLTRQLEAHEEKRGSWWSRIWKGKRAFFEKNNLS